MNRRDFIGGLISLVGLSSCAGYIESVMDERDLREGEFLGSLEKFVIEAETKISYSGEKTEVKGMGIVYGDYYFTLAHIVDYTDGVPVRTPFGMQKIKPGGLTFSTNIKGVELEKVMFDKNDVAIFKIPEHLRVDKFPLDIKREVKQGERVAVLGHPGLRGYHSRIGRVTDVNGITLDEGSNISTEYSNSIGTDIDVIGGDSGTPVISMRDKKLVGLMGLKFGGMSYFQPIKNFLEYVK